MAGERARLDALLDAQVANLESIRAEIAKAFPVDPGSVDPQPSIATVKVKLGDNVQAAFDSLLASGGVIKLAPGIHKVDLKIPERQPASKLITFTSDSTNFPAEGKRTSPEFAPAMGILQNVDPSGFAVRGQNKSRNVAFVNMGIAPPVTPSYTQVEFGGDKRNMPTPADRPENFVFDRVYIYGDPVKGAHRGISLNLNGCKVVGSYFRDIFEVGRDSQACGAWNGAQNILLDNCYFEGGAENVMFGGSDSASPEMTCQDVIIRGCDFSKNIEWMKLAAQPAIKCLFEIKNVKRLLMEWCRLDHNWARDWPTGVAITLKACNGENIETWATCEDVTLQNILVRNVGSVFSMIGKNDSGRVSDWMRRVKISNLLAHSIGNAPYTGTKRGCPFANGAEGSFELDHITMHSNAHSWMNTWFDSGITQAPGKLVVKNSVMVEGEYGYISSTNGIGFGAVAKDFASYEAEGNVWRVGTRPQGTLPPNNLRIPAAAWDASFGANHEVLAGSEISKVKTTDGKLPGADVAALQARWGEV